MEIRGIQDVRDLQLLLELVQSQMNDAANDGSMEKLERLNGIANGLQEAIREHGQQPVSSGDDIGWTLLD